MSDLDLDGILDDALDELEETSKYIENETETKENDIEKEDEIVNEALNAVSESIKDANESQNDMMEDSEFKEFFNQIFKSFATLDDDQSDQSLNNALKNIMNKFFDAESLKEPINTIVNKYPNWLKLNKNKLNKNEFDNYTKQFELYKNANDLLKKKNPPNDKIMEIILKTFSYGSLPPDVMDGMMPEELTQFTQKMSEWEKQIENIDANKETNENDKNDKKNEKNDKKDTNNIKNNVNNDNNKNNDKNDESKEDNLSNDDAMKMFEKMFLTKDNSNEKNEHDFQPNFNDVPKLSKEEMKQFKQIMDKDCLIM